MGYTKNFYRLPVLQHNTESIMIRQLGNTALNSIQATGRSALFALEAVLRYVLLRPSLDRLLQKVYEIGVRSTPLVMLVGLFSGMVIGLQIYKTLVRFGAESQMGSAVAMSLIRELGPVFGAIMIVAQAGSAMSAQIGIQRNSEQIDALEIMRIEPLSFLIGPRLLAALICFPVCATFFNIIGIWGGYVSGVLILGTDPGVYWANLISVVEPSDVWGGLLKSLIFALVTTTICTSLGYFTHLQEVKGAQAVSNSTIRSVVYSCVAVLICDFLITAFQIG